ncbi:helix-turn-helix domain-containing protein [Niabella hirudinis]|uniref:helix-turn-helix domain-containing protein n=1 Tax=Niabella hirudinis TaxID=1285929 RepID=UPI003EBBF798
MRKFSMLVFLYTVLLASASAQDSAAYSKIFDEVYYKIAPKNTDRALDIADSLYRNSLRPLYKAKSLMLSASIYEVKEDPQQAVAYAERAYKLIRSTDDNIYQVTICGFLAGQYRNLKLYDRSRHYCQKATELAPVIKNPEQRNTMLGFIQQELAYCQMAQGHYPAALQYLYNARRFLSLSGKNRSFVMGHNEQQLGQCFYNMKIYDSAIAHFKETLDLLPGQFNYITSLAYNYLAASYIEKNEFKKARPFIDSATKFVQSLQDLNIKNKIYKTLQTYYAKTGDPIRMEQARQMQDSLSELMSKNKAVFFESSYNALEKKQKDAEAKNSRKTIYVITCLIVLFAGSFSFVFYRKKQKKKLGRLKKMLEQVRTRTHPPALTEQPVLDDTAPQRATFINNPEHTDSKKEDKKAGPSIHTGTEQKLLASLQAFENSGHFNDNNMSLSYLAAHLGTNTKYLSFVIRKYKEKDFNAYINELRINHIVDNLKNNKAWRQYKISTLAATAGFSSHSQFAAIFKSITGVSPSVFIRYLDHEEH